MRYVRAPRQRRISALLRCAELASRNLELEAEAKSLRAMLTDLAIKNESLEGALLLQARMRDEESGEPDMTIELNSFNFTYLCRTDLTR